MTRVAFTAERRRIDRLVDYAERLMAQTEALNAVVRTDVIQAHQMVLDAATEYRRAVHVLRCVARAKEVAGARRLAREYLKGVGA